MANVHQRRRVVRRLYPRLSTTEIAEQLGVSQSTIANDVTALRISAPRGPRRKHPQPSPRDCEVCGGEFTPKDASQDLRGFGRICSERCRRRKGGLAAATARHQRADQELARVNAAGYLILHQVAKQIRAAESSVIRYVEEDFLEVAERRIVEGEHWTLVHRDELERFKAEHWPIIRTRHAELRRRDKEQGGPKLPSTWAPLTQRRHKNRMNGLDGGRGRNDARPDYEEALQRIRDEYERTHATERDLMRATRESRRMVRTALGRSV